LISAILWAGIGIWPFLRYRFFSPFERSMTAFAILISIWAGLDWFFLGLTDPTQANLAVLLSNIRISVFTAAILALVLSSKWIYLGHSRWDLLIGLPVAGSLLIIWTGLTSDVQPASWGPRLIRDPFRYALWATQQVAYIGTSVVLTTALWLQRKHLASKLRSRIFWTAGSLLAMLIISLSTNIYNNVTQTAGVPWLSSLLIVPAAIIMVALIPLSLEEIDELFRGVSAVEERARAVYLFYKSGEPLVALSADRTYPIEAEQLEGVLSIVGNFVETSVARGHRYDITAMRYDALGILAVRGQFVIAAAVYDGRAYDALRSELLRIVRKLEDRFGQNLTTWEQATRVAEMVANELSALIHRPRREIAGTGDGSQEALQMIARAPTSRKGPP
jgi:hypothetical protein